MRSRPLRIVLVDTDPGVRARMRRMIGEIGGAVVVGEAGSEPASRAEAMRRRNLLPDALVIGLPPRRPAQGRWFYARPDGDEPDAPLDVPHLAACLYRVRCQVERESDPAQGMEQVLSTGGSGYNLRGLDSAFHRAGRRAAAQGREGTALEGCRISRFACIRADA